MEVFMEYKVTIENFEGPLDLLLHLIKQDNIDIMDISIEKITKQYLEYINLMEEMNLNVASEYLVMAAELLEMKSSILLPHNNDVEDDYEEDPRQKLINRLLEYKYYKDSTENFIELEKERQQVFTKEVSDVSDFIDLEEQNKIDATLDDLIVAFQKFLENKENLKPLKTKIRSAQRNGIIIHKGNKDNLNFLYNQTKKKYPRGLKYFEDAYNFFNQSKKAEFYYAKLDTGIFLNRARNDYQKEF